MKKIFVFMVLASLMAFGVIMGCTQTTATTTTTTTTTTATTTTTLVSYSQAATDLTTVATGLQSSSGGASDSAASAGNTAGGATLEGLSISSIRVLDVKPTAEGWSEDQVYTYVWTTEAGATVIESGHTQHRFLDADGNFVLEENMVTIEGTFPDITVSFVPATIQMHGDFSSDNYLGETNMLADFPDSFGFPMTMTSSGDATLTFLSTPPATFEMSMTMVQTMAADSGEGSGSMSWSYQPPSGAYRLYYGDMDMTMSIENEVGTPSAMTGDAYQDLTDDGVQNGNVVGTITMDPTAGIILITLGDGTEIYAGTF